MQVLSADFLFLICAICPMILSFFLYVCPNANRLAVNTAVFIFPFVSLSISLFFLSGFNPEHNFKTHKIFGLLDIVILPERSLFASVTSLLWILTNIYSQTYMQNPQKSENMFFAYISISMFCVLCISYSADLMFTFIMYEFLTVFTYKLVTYRNTAEAKQAGNYYIITLITLSIGLFLPAVIALYIHGYTGAIGTLCKIYKEDYIWFSFAFYATVYGIAKIALMPAHGWLVRAMAAPAPVSAFLHSVAVVKSGIFILIILVSQVFGTENLSSALSSLEIKPLLTYIASISVFMASFFAIGEKNIKKILAYSTVSNLSMMVLNISFLSVKSLQTAFFFMISHAFAKISLFFFAGIVEKLYAAKEIPALKGLVRKNPGLAVCATICMSAIIGLPPTSGFWNKIYSSISAMEADSMLALVTIISSTALSSVYFGSIVCAIFSENNEVKSKKIPIKMYLPIIITSAITVIIFFIPEIISGFVKF